MQLKKHSCPFCGSKNLESYKSRDYMYIICENCKETIKTHTLKKIRPELLEIKKAEESMIRRAMPAILFMVVFTVIFAIALRLIMNHLGVPLQ